MILSALIRKYAGEGLATPTGATTATIESMASDELSQQSQVPLSQEERRKKTALTFTPNVAIVATVSVANRDARIFAIAPPTGAPFTPYCVPISGECVAAMLAEIQDAIGALAEAENWPDAHRMRLLEILQRQPAATLADDLAHFRLQLNSSRTQQAAAAAARQVG